MTTMQIPNDFYTEFSTTTATGLQWIRTKGELIHLASIVSIETSHQEREDQTEWRIGIRYFRVFEKKGEPRHMYLRFTDRQHRDRVFDAMSRLVGALDTDQPDVAGA